MTEVGCLIPARVDPAKLAVKRNSIAPYGAVEGEANYLGCGEVKGKMGTDVMSSECLSNLEQGFFFFFFLSLTFCFCFIVFFFFKN